jgi:hypothetical protein
MEEKRKDALEVEEEEAKAPQEGAEEASRRAVSLRSRPWFLPHAQRKQYIPGAIKEGLWSNDGRQNRASRYDSV